MAKNPTQSLTTNEFSKLTGIPVATVGKLLRDGKLKGEKVSGRWMIAADQAKRQMVQELSSKGGSGKAVQSKSAAEAPKSEPKTPVKPPKPDSPQKGRIESPPKAGAKSLSIPDFSRLTYLTDYGVEEYLKTGRLRGSKDAQGNWRIDAGNLDDPSIKHLIR